MITIINPTPLRMPFKGLFKPMKELTDEQMNANLNGCGLWTESEDDLQLAQERAEKEEKKREKEAKKRAKEEEKEKKRQIKVLTDEEVNNRLKAMGMWTEEELEEDMAKARMDTLEKKIMKLEKEKLEITTVWGEKWGLAGKDEVKNMDELKVDEKKPMKKMSLRELTDAAWANKDELKVKEKKPMKKMSLRELTDAAWANKDELKVEEKKPMKKMSLRDLTDAAWGSHASGLAGKDELKVVERKQKLSLSALTDKKLSFARFDGYELNKGLKEPKNPKKKFSLGSCVENMDEDEKWQRIFTSMGIGDVETHKKFSEEMERNKLPEDTPLSKTDTIKFVLATFAIGLILFGLINVFFTSSSVPPTQFTFHNKTYEGYGLLLNWSASKKASCNNGERIERIVHNKANVEVIPDADIAVVRSPGTDVSKEILFEKSPVEVRLQYYLIAFFGYPLLGATLLAGLLYGIFCRSVEIRTVTLVETIGNEDFGVKIKYGKISEVSPGGLADVSGEVEKGDRVIRVNGVRIGTMADDNVADLINAREGELKLTMAA